MLKIATISKCYLKNSNKYMCHTDGLEAKYTENAYHGQAAAPPRRDNDRESFDQMLFDARNTINRRIRTENTD